MDAAMTGFAVPPGMGTRMERLADQIRLGMSRLKGFVSVTVFLNEQTNVYGGFGLWEVEEDVTAARELTGPNLKEELEAS